MPTDSQLCTLCNRLKEQLAQQSAAMQFHERELEKIRANIIAIQGALAGVQVALGEPYDPTTVPVELKWD